jgi:SpoVK/Ycf46/Vps4 family AAA+-type ATPase
VVPDKLREALEDFSFEAQDRTTFWESPSARRLFPRGTGLVALFSGPPGTGKTMAAQVIAADLELDLFRIDLATTVSKYIGETAKHLGQIFSRAARMNAVLLFDEADALFSKRTEVKDSHDRYANQEVSYLLQRVESFSGLVILSTNFKTNIDDAFLRRFNAIIKFPFPDAKLRQSIWEKSLPERATLDSDVDLEEIAVRYKLTGGNIINAVHLASLKAMSKEPETITLRDMLHGIKREVEKEGKIFSNLLKNGVNQNGIK